MQEQQQEGIAEQKQEQEQKPILDPSNTGIQNENDDFEGDDSQLTEQKSTIEIQPSMTQPDQALSHVSSQSQQQDAPFEQNAQEEKPTQQEIQPCIQAILTHDIAGTSNTLDILKATLSDQNRKIIAKTTFLQFMHEAEKSNTIGCDLNHPDYEAQKMRFAESLEIVKTVITHKAMQVEQEQPIRIQDERLINTNDLNTVTQNLQEAGINSPTVMSKVADNIGEISQQTQTNPHVDNTAIQNTQYVISNITQNTKDDNTLEIVQALGAQYVALHKNEFQPFISQQKQAEQQNEQNLLQATPLEQKKFFDHLDHLANFYQMTQNQIEDSLEKIGIKKDNTSLGEWKKIQEEKDKQFDVKEQQNPDNQNYLQAVKDAHTKQLPLQMKLLQDNKIAKMRKEYEQLSTANAQNNASTTHDKFINDMIANNVATPYELSQISDDAKKNVTQLYVKQLNALGANDINEANVTKILANSDSWLRNELMSSYSTQNKSSGLTTDSKSTTSQTLLPILQEVSKKISESQDIQTASIKSIMEGDDFAEIRKLDPQDVRKHLIPNPSLENARLLEKYESIMHRGGQFDLGNSAPSQIKKHIQDTEQDVISDFKKIFSAKNSSDKLTTLYQQQHKNYNLTPSEVHNILSEHYKKSKDNKQEVEFTNSYKQLLKQTANTPISVKAVEALCVKDDTDKETLHKAGMQTATNRLRDIANTQTYDKHKKDEEYKKLPLRKRLFTKKPKQPDGTMTALQKDLEVRQLFGAMQHVDIKDQKQKIQQYTTQQIFNEINPEEAKKWQDAQKQMQEYANQAPVLYAEKIIADRIQQELKITPEILRKYSQENQQKISHRLQIIAKDVLQSPEMAQYKQNVEKAENTSELQKITSSPEYQQQLTKHIAEAKEDMNLALAAPVDDIQTLKKTIGEESVEMLKQSTKKQRTPEKYAETLLKQYNCTEKGGNEELEKTKQKVEDQKEKNDQKKEKKDKEEKFSKKLYMLALLCGVNPIAALFFASPGALQEVGKTLRAIVGAVLAVAATPVALMNGLAHKASGGKFAEGWGQLMDPVTHMMGFEKNTPDSIKPSLIPQTLEQEQKAALQKLQQPQPVSQSPSQQKLDAAQQQAAQEVSALKMNPPSTLNRSSLNQSSTKDPRTQQGQNQNPKEQHSQMKL